MTNKEKNVPNVGTNLLIFSAFPLAGFPLQGGSNLDPSKIAPGSVLISDDTFTQTRKRYNSDGSPRASVTHHANDVLAAEGTPVVSPVFGVVTDTGWNGLGGWYVIVEAKGTKHAWQLYFAHLTAPSHLQDGAKVVPGDLLGLVGNTGGKKRGARKGVPHLHLSVHQYPIGSPKGVKQVVSPLRELMRFLVPVRAKGAHMRYNAAQPWSVEYLGKLTTDIANHYGRYLILGAGRRI